MYGAVRRHAPARRGAGGRHAADDALSGHYELTWLGIAIFCLIAHGLDEGWLPGDGILVLAWLLPVFEMFNRLTKLPQIGPVVLLAVLLVVVRRAAVASRTTP